MTDEARSRWRRFRKTRDPDLRDAFICEHIELVRRVASRLALRLPPHVNLDDLEAAGIPGLLDAVDAYDPEKDVEFTAFAQTRIRGAILDELRRLDPLPRSIRDKARRIERATALLQQQLFRPPTDEEVASQLLMSLTEYYEVQRDLRAGLQVSLDAGWGGGPEDGDEDGGPPSLEGRAPTPWQALAFKEQQNVLGAVIEELPEVERLVLSLYYYEELTMKEIGLVLEVSESRVSQIHSAALLRIRNRLRRRRLRPEDLHLEEHGSAITGRLARAAH